MDWTPSNKENECTAKCGASSMMTICKNFRRSLFDTPKAMSVDVPKQSPPWLQSMADSPSQESPFQLFKYRKKRNRTSYETSHFSESPSKDLNVSTPVLKRNVLCEIKDNNQMDTQDVYDDSAQTSIVIAVQKSLQEPNLIGDFSKPCLLPVIDGKHPDLKTVTPETVAGVINGCASINYMLIDCRYPYEYDGGHIKDALNIYAKDDMASQLLNTSLFIKKNESRDVLIFYCEFSSERGPRMLRFLRNRDREMNKHCYPFLYYPEVYLMEGGYKAFYSAYKALCVPQEYKTMQDENNAAELAFFRSKCRSSRRSKRGKSTRSVLQF